MAEKPTAPGTSSTAFEEFLKSCPDIDDTAPEPLRLAGTVMRTKAADSFAFMAADGSRHDIPRAAVTAFTALSSGTAGRVVELTLDRARLPEDLLGKLGGIKIPFEKSPPLDTAKEIGGGDTWKEGIFDTLKEAGGGDTLKEQPFDTIKEIGGGDTFKEAPWDTFKELGGGDTLKEIGGGDNTGINDSAIEGIGQPGSEVVNPAIQARALNTNFGGFGGGGGGFPTLKEGPADTLKEIGGGDTLKELPGDGTRKEVPFDTLKESGGGDTLKELGGGDTLKEGPADTLKELGGGDTFKEGPSDTLKELGGGDTLKELGGGDTLKEGPFDTLKELVDETVKESPFDTLKEASGGEGTGVADTLVEGIGQPGGELVNPAVLAMQGRSAAMAGAMPGAQAFGGQPIGAAQGFVGKPVTDKSPALDKNFKEVIHDHTLKELINDPKHIKEVVKEFWKEVAWEGPFGTGVGDSLAEGIFDPGSLVTNPGNFAQAAGGIPFVLATPHQASQGAVAQQMLAAQALAGRIGF